MPTGETRDSPIETSLGRMATSFWVSRAIYVAAKIRVADLLAQGPRPIAFLADNTKSNPDALFRLLRALSGVGVFKFRNNGDVELTSLGHALRADAEGSMRDYVMMLGRPESWRAWEHLDCSIATGIPAFEREYNSSLFRYLAANPEVAHAFDEGMRTRGIADDRAIAKAYDFSTARRVADLGGGVGRLLTSVLQAAPHAEGMLFDLPHVVSAAQRSLAACAVGRRIEFIGGDFFDVVPAGADVYLLKQVLHDWNDGQASKLLINCRQAMSETSKVLIIELVVDADSNFAKLLDLMMLVWTGGRERTKEEYEGLLADADLALVKIHFTETSICILEAMRR